MLGLGAFLQAILSALYAPVQWLWQQVVDGWTWLCNLLPQMVQWLIDLLPASVIDWLHSNPLAGVYELIRGVNYIVPVVPLVGIWLLTLQIIVAIRVGRWVKSFIPGAVHNGGG